MSRRSARRPGSGTDATGSAPGARPEPAPESGKHAV